MNIYAQYLAARAAHDANQRLMDIWRLGSFASPARYIAHVEHVTIAPRRTA